MGYPTVMGTCGCGDPGAKTTGAHLSILDYQFCPYRLQNGPGFLVSQVTGSGQYQIAFSTSPVPNLDTFQTILNQNFGNIVGILANGQMRQLLGPATANLVPMTDTAGGVAFRALPAATIPDPLNLTAGSFVNLTVSGALTLTGTMSATGLPTGTISTTIGLDGSGNLVKGTGSSGVQTAMFFESPSGSSVATPNAAVMAGGFLIIGNLLYDSGGGIATVTDSQTVAVAVAGKYQIQWFGQIDDASNFRVGMTIQLVVNGIMVNNGNCYPIAEQGASNGARTMPISGMECRNLAMNDTVKLQLSSGSGATLKTYQVRLVLTKIG